jgi:hypothetical protein
MSRIITVGAAQLGPIHRADARPEVVKRLLNFAKHRRPEHYRMIVDRTGALPPP